MLTLKKFNKPIKERRNEDIKDGYIANLESILEKQQADIDYIAMMADIDIPVEEDYYVREN